MLFFESNLPCYLSMRFLLIIFEFFYEAFYFLNESYIKFIFIIIFFLVFFSCWFSSLNFAFKDFWLEDSYWCFKIIQISVSLFMAWNSAIFFLKNCSSMTLVSSCWFFVHLPKFRIQFAFSMNWIFWSQNWCPF